MSVQKTYALVLGIVLLILGVWGFFSQSILGIFGVNNTQSVLHVVGGLLGIWFGTKGSGKSYNLWLGWIALILGILGFIPQTATLLATYFNINTGITWLHVAVGILSLIIAYAVK